MTKWTNEQSSFIDAVGKADDSISLRAVAGAGKTTTAVAAINAYADEHSFASATCVAFNKKIADELGQRMPSSVESKTMNAIGHRAWARHTDRRLEVSTRKTFMILRDMHGRDYRLPEGMEDIPKLVSNAKAGGLVPASQASEAHNILLLDEQETWEALIDHFDLAFPEDKQVKAITEAREVLSRSIKMAFDGLIDFNDQPYMPVCFGGQWTKNDLVLIDEAQDISGIQREMLRNMLNGTGRLVAVGDPRQAIYGFRGAASDSMDRLASEFRQVRMDLTYTFRCSKAVTNEARALVPDIKCPDDATEGSVSYLEDWKLADVPRTGAIICRNTKPLVDLAFRMIHRQLPCFVLGRDIGKSLIRLIDTMKAGDLLELSEKLEEYARYAIAKANRLGRPERAESVRDRVGTIHICIDALEGSNPTIADLKNSIEKLFSDLRGGVCLSTIHKAKGLEWDTVYFLDPSLIPSRYAVQDWQLEQESNLRYVGITRAHVDLKYVDSSRAK